MTILNPKQDYIKKRQGAGGAIPLDKQKPEKLEFDLEKDEPLVMIGEIEPAVLNDPSRPRLRGVSLEKQLERFKFQPDEDPGAQDELIVPIELKPVPKPKILFTMDKGKERFPV